MIKVFSQPGCHACEDTKTYLAKNSFEFTDVDNTKSPAAIAELEKIGSQSTPTVVTDSEFWIGHRVDKLAKLHA
jgi:glutaredoxin